MGIKEKLMHDARERGICIDGYKEMKSSDIYGLIDYYLRTIDWSLERDFPTLEFIRENLVCRGSLHYEDKGIYVDREFDKELIFGQQINVFHHCSGIIDVAMDYDAAIIPMLYFANGCDIKITCSQENDIPIKVPVYIFGENKVEIEKSKNAIFNIYKK